MDLQNLAKSKCICPCCGKTVINFNKHRPYDNNCKNKKCYVSKSGLEITLSGVKLNDVIISKKQVDEYCKSFKETDRNEALRAIHIDTALNCQTTKHLGLYALAKAIANETKLKNKILYK